MIIFYQTSPMTAEDACRSRHGKTHAPKAPQESKDVTGRHDGDDLQNELNLRHASRRRESLEEGCDSTSRDPRHRRGEDGGSSTLRSQGSDAVGGDAAGGALGVDGQARATERNVDLVESGARGGGVRRSNEDERAMMISECTYARRRSSGPACATRCVHR